VKIGSLCTGYGGLDLAAEAFFGAETIWCADNDKYAAQVIEQRFGIANFGDIKSIHWETVPDIDILTAGYPCQPFSHAGERKGTDDPRHIFPYIAKALDALRPRYFIFENVRGHLSLGFKEVLEILAPMGYVIKWGIVRASDAGAPHRRERLFIYGELESSYADRIRREFREPTTQGNQGESQFKSAQCSETATHANSCTCEESRRTGGAISGTSSQFIDWSNRHEYGGCSSIDSNTNNKHQSYDRQMQKLGRRFTPRREMHMLTAPNALDQDNKLNAKFVEYMMGLPAGWVTDCGLTRAQQLKMLGNGVVPQQAELALELLTNGQ
jgi:DNA (cytosine-5)-methyltransferase 1